MKNKVILDIGTHEAEELKILLNFDSKKILYYFRWWLSFIKYKVKKILNYKINFRDYGYYKSPLEINILSHRKILIFLFKIFSQPSAKYNIIVIEPNIKKLFKSSDKLIKNYNLKTFPIAINIKNKKFGISSFFLNNNSLSSSLINKKKSNFKINILSVDFNILLVHFLRKKILTKNDNLILRINCEGAEYGIIKNLINKKIYPKFILVYLGDKKKNQVIKYYKQIISKIKKKGIEYVYFKGTDPSTWLYGINKFKNL